jgi:hypothetical protein
MKIHFSNFLFFKMPCEFFSFVKDALKYIMIFIEVC